jgi:hypothetical protein
VEYNSGTLAYTKHDNKSSIFIGIFFPKTPREKRREEIWFQICSRKVLERYLWAHRSIVSPIVENKRSISLDMVEDAIEDARE